MKTLVKNTKKPLYSNISEEMIKRLQNDGHRLVLWTYRYGKKLNEAVAFCKENGIEFYAVNASFPNEIFEGKMSRKIAADIFIDDRNIGGFPGWGSIYQQLTKEEAPNLKGTKKNIFSRLFK